MEIWRLAAGLSRLCLWLVTRDGTVLGRVPTKKDSFPNTRCIQNTFTRANACTIVNGVEHIVQNRVGNGTSDRQEAILWENIKSMVMIIQWWQLNLVGLAQVCMKSFYRPNVLPVHSHQHHIIGFVQEKDAIPCSGHSLSVFAREFSHLCHVSLFRDISGIVVLEDCIWARKRNKCSCGMWWHFWMSGHRLHVFIGRHYMIEAKGEVFLRGCVESIIKSHTKFALVEVFLITSHDSMWVHIMFMTSICWVNIRNQLPIWVVADNRNYSMQLFVNSIYKHRRLSELIIAVHNIAAFQFRSTCMYL